MIYYTADSACSSALSTAKASPRAIVLSCWGHSTWSDIESGAVEMSWHKVGEYLWDPQSEMGYHSQIRITTINCWFAISLQCNKRVGVLMGHVNANIYSLSTAWYVLRLGWKQFWLSVSKFLDGWSSMFCMTCLLNLSFRIRLRSGSSRLIHRILLISCTPIFFGSMIFVPNFHLVSTYPDKIQMLLICRNVVAIFL